MNWPENDCSITPQMGFWQAIRIVGKEEGGAVDSKLVLRGEELLQAAHEIQRMGQLQSCTTPPVAADRKSALAAKAAARICT